MLFDSGCVTSFDVDEFDHLPMHQYALLINKHTVSFNILSLTLNQQKFVAARFNIEYKSEILLGDLWQPFLISMSSIAPIYLLNTNLSLVNGLKPVVV